MDYDKFFLFLLFSMHFKWLWKILQILEKTSTHFKNKKKTLLSVCYKLKFAKIFLKNFSKK